MDPFEQVWETSRHNSWSWGYPTALVLGVVVLIALSLIRKAALRRPLKAVAILAFAFVATEFSAREIHEKWRLRGEWADAHKDQMTDAGWDALTVDGANRALGPLLHGVQAALLLVAVAFVLGVIRRAAFPAASSKADPDAPESDIAKPSPLSSST
jgi:hypothetical protein